jgi:hypothetical protein
MYRNFLLLFVVFLLFSGAAKAEVSEESALLAIGRAEGTINEMLGMGFNVAYANDTLNEARNLFREGYYEASELLAESILEIKEKAMEVDGLIDQVELKIYEMSSRGYNVSSAYVIFDSGISEFNVGNYVDAEISIKGALDELDEIEAWESIKRVQEMEFDVSPVLDGLWILIILFLLLLIIGLKTREKINVKKLKGKLKLLERETENVKKSLGETQREYFERGSISKTDYDISAKRYNKRLTKIKRLSSALEDKLKNH